MAQIIKTTTVVVEIDDDDDAVFDAYVTGKVRAGMLPLAINEMSGSHVTSEVYSVVVQGRGVRSFEVV